MKKVITVLVVLLPLAHVGAQTQTHRRNIVHVEIWGSTLGYALNFERVIPRNNSRALSIRGGMAVLSNRFSLPVSVQYFSVCKAVSLEGMLGMSYLYGAQQEGPRDARSYGSGIFFTPGIGYRFQGGEGFFFRVTAFGLIKLVEFTNNEAIQNSRFVPSLGVSMGYSF